jgi:sugar lactone lactonase YvrE
MRGNQGRRLRTLIMPILLCAFLVACGGAGRTDPVLTINADATQATAGAAPVTLMVARTSLDAAVTWSLEPAGVGSLDATSGDRVHYIPPPAGSIENDIAVTLTAVSGSLRQQVSISVHASPGLYLVAGTTGGRGYADGTGTAARFNNALGIAVDNAGNFFVADSGNHTIRKITPSGVVSTIAGTVGLAGSRDGTIATAQFNRPSAIALDGVGNLYIADAENNTIRKIAPDGLVTTVAGLAGVYGGVDGAGAAARFSGPRGIATDSTGNVYVIEAGNYAIRKITPDGTVTTFAGALEFSGIPVDGVGVAARFYNPNAIAMDKHGNLYVTDKFGVRKVTPSSAVTTIAGDVNFGGRADGQGTTARFNAPNAIATDASGNLYVFDEGFMRKVAPTGAVTTIVQRPDLFELETYSQARVGMTATADGHVYVTANTIKHVTPAGDVTTVAGDAGNVGGIADGIGAGARFTRPSGIVAASTGTLFLIDELNSTALREVSLEKVVTTLTAPSDVNRYTALATDKSGNLYAATAQWMICDCSTVFGTNAIIKKPATGPDQVLLGSSAAGMTTDGSGNLFFTYDGAIRKLSPTGTVSVLGEGLMPSGIVTSADGTLFFVDSHSIRKLTAGGAMTTVAGSVDVHGASDGKGTSARFHSPTAITIDPAGNLYVADTGNHTIRKIAVDGTVTTLAGSSGKVGVTTGALPGSLDTPNGLAFVGPNLLFVTTGKSVLRLILP